jgi:4-methylaminobutanoate oxidase (formaldehyde-forming)
LTDPGSILFRDEPVWQQGYRVGRITSGAFGHTLGASVGLGWIDTDSGSATDQIADGGFEIEIAGERVPAIASLSPFYDPKGLRFRDGNHVQELLTEPSRMSTGGRND